MFLCKRITHDLIGLTCKSSHAGAKKKESERSKFAGPGQSDPNRHGEFQSSTFIGAFHVRCTLIRRPPVHGGAADHPMSTSDTNCQNSPVPRGFVEVQLLVISFPDDIFDRTRV